MIDWIHHSLALNCKDMHISFLAIALWVIGPLVPLTTASPLQVRQDIPTTCGPIITALSVYGNPTPFCSSYLGLSTDAPRTVIQYTTTSVLFNYTLTLATGTQIVTASTYPINVTFTASPSVATEIV